MGEERPYASQRDYEVPLLRLLYDLPTGEGSVQEVMDLFHSRYGDQIPDEHRNRRASYSREALWQNYVRRSRQGLKARGFLNAPRRGVWRISQAGRSWAEANPGQTHITGVPKRRSRRDSSRKAPAPAITLDMLEKTREVMPADQFRELWGVLYETLLAEERAKAISRISQTELRRRTGRQIDEIHTFLGGKAASTPPSEKLCDWIHFCYALELHREAAALLPYVREDEVDPAIYKRTRRVAEVCRSKLAG